MHWVDRGPKPRRLGAICITYTQAWIQHYQYGVGTRPNDTRWREFRGELEQAFSGLCGYCERPCRGEVDHFRPKSLFPASVYEWSNWIFACNECNSAKLDKWPDGGYIDPCTLSRNARPERFFTFDTLTGEMLPKADLSVEQRRRSQRMIQDLRLNAHHHLKQRKFLLVILSTLGRSATSTMPYECRAFLASRSTEHSSVTRTWLFERGFAIED